MKSIVQRAHDEGYEEGYADGADGRHGAAYEAGRRDASTYDPHPLAWPAIVVVFALIGFAMGYWS